MIQGNKGKKGEGDHLALLLGVADSAVIYRSGLDDARRGLYHLLSTTDTIILHCCYYQHSL